MDVIDNSLEASEERDVDDMLREKEEITVTQSLTIVEDDASLGSTEDQSAVVGLAHTMIDGEDGDVQYFQPGNGSAVYKVVALDESNSLQLSSDYTPSSNLMHQTVLATGSLNGPLYVIGSPRDVFGSSQEGRSGTTRQSEPNRISGVRRDDRRRATHNEVERRRRDKINTQITELSKMIPDCHFADSAKAIGQSKGGILSKACRYITDIRESNAQLAKRLAALNKELEQVKRENDNLREENSSLRTQLNIDTKVMDL